MSNRVVLSGVLKGDPTTCISGNNKTNTRAKLLFAGQLGGLMEIFASGAVAVELAEFQDRDQITVEGRLLADPKTEGVLISVENICK